MKKNDNMLWRFFASVKLALFTLFFLALTSIIGTLIPQKNPPEFYIQEFGPKLAEFFRLLNIPDMYNSWWFLALLFLFSMNLIVCTLDRLPNVWRMVVMDNLATESDRLKKMPDRRTYFAKADLATTTETVKALMKAAGWGPQSKAEANHTLHFSQKGAWSRLGVYCVHMSILVIFAGAIIGTIAGFKGSVMIPEGSSTNKIYEFGTSKAIDLGFEVRCDSFSLSYYDNGMPKEYRSDLTVIDPAAGPNFSKSIIVNDPLDHNGITFYQSSYRALQGYKVVINDKKNNRQQSFQVPFGQKVNWPGTTVDFGIINAQGPRDAGATQLKIWFSDGADEPEKVWMNTGSTYTFNRAGGEFEFYAKQLYATGLQVAKDPGVWTVYIGCIMMLIGLYVAFFLSHRRIWVYIEQEADQCRVLVAGTTSKNKLGFEKDFSALTERFNQNDTLQNA